MAWRGTGSQGIKHPIAPGARGETITWEPATVAAVVNIPATFGSPAPAFFGSYTSGETTRSLFYADVGGISPITMYNNSGGFASSLGAPGAEGWLCVVLVKDSSFNRYHKFVWTSGTWTRSTVGTGTVTAPGAGGLWWLYPFPGWGSAPAIDRAAAMYVPRMLTDSEVDQLPQGNWWRFSPLWHREFRRNTVAVGRNYGSDGYSVDSLASGELTPYTDPPGFRFSPNTRRR